MAQVRATVMDVSDIRAYECLLPDDVPVSELAAYLASHTRLPLVGPDNNPLEYGFVVRGGNALDPRKSLRELGVPRKLTVRLVPEVYVSQEGSDVEMELDTINPDDPTERLSIEVGEPISLLHDHDLGGRPDVRIDARVHREIEEFASEDRDTECVGLLLGSVSFEDGARVIHVSAIAPALTATGTRSSVVITLETWESMLQTRDTRYSHLRVLGWFHTHAGWGVFMSDADVFFHRHFFPHPNMVAYVLDPTTGRDGFFFWHEGKISLCPSYGLVGTPDEVDVSKPRSRRGGKRRPDARDVAIALLAVIVLYFAFLRPPDVVEKGAVKGRSATKPVVSVHHTAPAQASVHRRPAESTRPVRTQSGRERAGYHTVGRRESLWSICRREYGDGNLAEALGKYNHLDRIESLQAGQKLNLPSEAKLRALKPDSTPVERAPGKPVPTPAPPEQATEPHE